MNFLIQRVLSGRVRIVSATQYFFQKKSGFSGIFINFAVLKPLTMETKHQYKIPFVGLKEGKHLFEFTAGKLFFEEYQYILVDNVSLEATVELEKLSTMMAMVIKTQATYITQCDMCGDNIQSEASSENKLFIKFGEGESTDENILLLDQSEYEINVAELLFEFFVTSVPAKHKHPKGKCNQEVLAKLETYKVNETPEESNPMWDKLKELKK